MNSNHRLQIRELDENDPAYWDHVELDISDEEREKKKEADDKIKEEKAKFDEVNKLMK